MSQVLERPGISGLAEQGLQIKGSRLLKQAAWERGFVTVRFDGLFYAEIATRQREVTEKNLAISNKYIQ